MWPKSKKKKKNIFDAFCNFLLSEKTGKGCICGTWLDRSPLYFDWSEYSVFVDNCFVQCELFVLASFLFSFSKQ